jgi:hypothetical protein
VGRNLRWTGIAAGTVALTVLAACGSSAAKSDRPAKADISTWRAGTESGTAKLAGTGTIVTPGEPDRTEVTEGAIDFDRHRSEATTRVTGGKQPDHSYAQRSIGDTMYWWDPDNGPGGSAKPWTKSTFPWNAGNWQATLDRALVNPRATVTRTGTETLRGEPVTNYRVDYAPRVPPRLLARGYPMGLTDLQIAVDADGRVRRIRFTVHRSSKATAHEEFELYDYGTAVQVDAPPADEIDTSGTSAGVPVPTGPWTDLATDGTGADRIVVSAVPTTDGSCIALTGAPDENGWWTVAGRATASCFATADLAFGVAQIELVPVRPDLQVVTGQFDRATTAVTLRLDDGSKLTVTPRQGTFAAIVKGDRVVEKVEASNPSGSAACDFAPEQSPMIYQCQSGTNRPTPPDAFGVVPFPDTTSPTTTPGG